MKNQLRVLVTVLALVVCVGLVGCASSAPAAAPVTAPARALTTAPPAGLFTPIVGDGTAANPRHFQY